MIVIVAGIGALLASAVIVAALPGPKVSSRPGGTAKKDAQTFEAETSTATTASDLRREADRVLG